ncbi:hypothetical protein LCGC14_1422130 [marine sediment metagenome]|uniref:Homing endonuclease LAGLIDADG domain-containing protein n=1 Tax=marine sediment metagenome TaxID=412755 RepID=A0A0F9JRM9_9ZZZZ
MCVEAYIAGLFDGEGCVTVTRRIGGTRGVAYQLVVVFGMNDREGLDVVCSRFGGNVLGPNPKGTYTWAASGVNALAFLKVVRPHVRVKRQQVDVALGFTVGQRGRLVDLEERESIWRVLKALRAKAILAPCTS